ncbi:hypothetical protein GCM10011390_50080 [Aureimonas endophytica]|uniref:Uncharacterized protein n=1 Tax=Aureimonas endophytica TaxID=2027858 RepID=A0A917A4G3_9HYPH|nr:hypothetical protein [Aureimonas endophytica]GGE24632.1 hypothetical protein GCM10011390_50080 [Aureimonas endophytica]
MTKTVLLSLAIFGATFATMPASHAEEGIDLPQVLEQIDAPSAVADASDEDDRLMVINANTGRVVYDDGHDDVVCVKRNRVVGYDWYGRALYKRSVKCH